MRISTSAALLACVALQQAGLVRGHPGPSCPSVSSHTVLAASSAVVNYTDPQVAGSGYNIVAMFQTEGDDQLLATYGTPDTTYVPTGPYWDMDGQFVNGIFQVASSSVRGSARIAAYNDKFIIVYSESASLVSSKVVSATFSGVSSKVDLGALAPTFSVLVAGVSGFFWFAIEGVVLSVFTTANGTSWDDMNLSDLPTPTNDPIAAAVDVLGNVMIIFHLSSAGLGGGLSSFGTEDFVSISDPTVTGNNVAIASSAANTFLVIANDAGVISSCYTRNLGLTWSDALTVQATGVLPLSPVFVVKTNIRWVALWVSAIGSIQYRTTAVDLPTNWTAATLASFMTGTGSKFFSTPALVATGGQGWNLVTVDNVTSDISFRGCFNQPVTASPTNPSASPTVGNSASEIIVGHLMKLVLMVATAILVMM